MAKQDMFGVDHTTVGAFARAGEATIKIDDTQMPVLNAQGNYQEQTKLMPVGGGEIVGIGQMPTGQVKLGGILQSDFVDLLDTYGSADSLTLTDPLQIVLDSAIESSYPNVATGSCINCYNVKIDNYGFQTSIEGVLVQQNVQFLVLNMDKPTTSPDLTT